MPPHGVVGLHSVRGEVDALRRYPRDSSRAGTGRGGTHAVSTVDPPSQRVLFPFPSVRVPRAVGCPCEQSRGPPRECVIQAPRPPSFHCTSPVPRSAPLPPPKPLPPPRSDSRASFGITDPHPRRVRCRGSGRCPPLHDQRCVCLANGAARSPCGALQDAQSHAGRALLAGERTAVRPDGFDLGNSPLEFTREAVQGRDIAWTTTNGTRAIALLLEDQEAPTAGRRGHHHITSGQSPPRPPPVPRPYASTSSPFRSVASLNSCDLLLASYVNLTAAACLLEHHLREGDVVAIACSGRDGGFALEDSACAGALVRRLRAALATGSR